jgi:hypothetical protein
VVTVISDALVAKKPQRLLADLPRAVTGSVQVIFDVKPAAIDVLAQPWHGANLRLKNDTIRTEKGSACLRIVPPYF